MKVGIARASPMWVLTWVNTLIMTADSHGGWRNRNVVSRTISKLAAWMPLITSPRFEGSSSPNSQVGDLRHGACATGTVK